MGVGDSSEIVAVGVILGRAVMVATGLGVFVDEAKGVGLWTMLGVRSTLVGVASGTGVEVGSSEPRGVGVGVTWEISPPRVR